MSAIRSCLFIRLIRLDTNCKNLGIIWVDTVPYRISYTSLKQSFGFISILNLFRGKNLLIYQKCIKKFISIPVSGNK